MKLSSETLIMEAQPVNLEEKKLDYKEKPLQISLFVNFGLWG